MTPNHTQPYHRHGKSENAEQITLVFSVACILAFALAEVFKTT